MELIDWLGTLAGKLTTIFGFLALVFFNPIKNAIKQKRAEKAAEKKAREDQEKADRKAQADFQKQVLDKLHSLEQKIDSQTDDIADLQYERLSQAHDFYVESQGWCPTSKKHQLCEMYRSYSGKGRNHLSAHYEEDILHLPEKPKMKHNEE